MKLDALDHPKTFDFAARLQVELPTALGHLELLWAFTGKQAAQGNIGKWPDGAIARACYWMGRPELFIAALRDAGFIDADPDHRLTVHDWAEHAPGWVRAKLKKLDLPFLHSLDGSSEASSDGTLERSSEGSLEGGKQTSEASLEANISTSEASSRAPVLKGREGKGRVVKGSTRAGEPAPPGLDEAAFDRWLEYRTEIRKPLKPISIPAAQRELAAFGPDQSAVVEQSIAQGWTGLFALKKPHLNGSTGNTPRRERAKTADELEAEERARAAG